MSVMGLDIGTTGCKAIVFAEDGRILAQARREYGIDSPRPGWAEQDAETIWRLAFETLREAIAGAADDAPVALALSCQGEAVAPVDRQGRAMRPMMLGMDTRPTVENRWLADTFGADVLFQQTGMPLHTINTLPKLLWLQTNEPAHFAAAHQFLLYEDFFLRRLGGEAVISGCLASRTQMMNLRTGTWEGEILAQCGIEPRRLAQIAPGDGAAIGQLTDEMTSALGLQRPLLLAAGGHDQACAALGCGVVAPGLAMVSTGTAEVVEVALAEPTVVPPLQHAGISVYRHVVPGLYLAMTLNHSGGILLRWVRDTLGKWESTQALAVGMDAYDMLLQGAPAGPSGLLVLPHFAGSGTPTLDPMSRGAIIGLTTSTSLSALTKAVLEGLTFELRQNLDLLRENGIVINELRAVGGGARSPLWLQLKADVCNVSLRTVRSPDAACLGAAMLAAHAAGIYPSLLDAAAGMVQPVDCIEPHAADHTAYAPWYALHTSLYPQLRDLCHAVAAACSNIA